MAGVLNNILRPQPPNFRSNSNPSYGVKASSEPSESISVSTKSSEDTGAVVFTSPPGFKPPEPKRFAIKSRKLIDVLCASIGLIFRFGTGVFVSGGLNVKLDHILRANFDAGSMSKFYITFAARESDSPDAPLVEYQAKAAWSVADKTYPIFCRPSPPQTMETIRN